jgi:hypothetical protein
MEEQSMCGAQRHYPSARSILGCALALFVIVAIMPGTAHAAQSKQQAFKTPDTAVQALFKAISGSSRKDFLAIFGPGSETLISSGDAVEDRESREKFLRGFEEKNRMETLGNNKVILHVGGNDWPFPIPIVKSGERWWFDTAEGRDEIISRRIGKNELAAIQTCLAMVDAQREYAAVDHDGDGLLQYADRFMSAKGRKDGLYWKPGPGEDPSPLGPLFTRAKEEGYGKDTRTGSYHGYSFRILTAQGKNAHGGAYSYEAKGKLVGGFAIVAYPARYLVSGIKTFMVNQEGIVYQKDLGQKTERLAKAMKTFDPDKTWEKAE